MTTEISEKEIEAARAVLERRIYDEGGCEAEQVPAMVREMLEAAARVRAEAADGGEVASIPLGKGNVIDCGGANISQPLNNKHITIRDREAHPAPQPSWMVKALADALRGLLKAYENTFDWSVELPPETVEAERIANEVLQALTSPKPEPEGAALNKEGRDE